MNTLADPCSAMAGNAVSPAPVLEVGEAGSRTRMVRPAASPTRRGRVVEAGRATTAAGCVIAEFARAVERGDPHAIRLVDPLAPKTRPKTENGLAPDTSGSQPTTHSREDRSR